MSPQSFAFERSENSSHHKTAGFYTQTVSQLHKQRSPGCMALRVLVYVYYTRKGDRCCSPHTSVTNSLEPTTRPGHAAPCSPAQPRPAQHPGPSTPHNQLPTDPMGCAFIPQLHGFVSTFRSHAPGSSKYQ